jgi:uncharacterized protein YcaQ
VEEAQRAHMNSMRNYSALLEDMQRMRAEQAKAEDLMEPFAQQLQTVMQDKSNLLKEIQEVGAGAGGWGRGAPEPWGWSGSGWPG